MDTRTARKIERYARVNGISFSRAASELQARAVRARMARRRRKSDEERNHERFERMRAGRPDLYE